MPTLTPESLAAVFVQPHPDGRFDGAAAAHLRALGAKRRCVILAFPPKAAGTFFRTAVLQAVDGQLLRVVHALGGRDASLYLPTFISYFSGNLTPQPMVGHVHMQALPANVNFLEAFDIRPVVMVRSIPDMLASYWDMLESDPEARKDGLNCQIPDDFPSMTAARKADFLLDILGPWYGSYFATWFRYASEAPNRVCVLHYSELRADPVRTLMRAVAHAGLARTREQCRIALDQAWAVRDECRFNKGEDGRGARYFTPEHIARLERILGAYSHLAPHRDELLSFTRPALAQAV
jgi:hypothetical protein